MDNENPQGEKEIEIPISSKEKQVFSMPKQETEIKKDIPQEARTKKSIPALDKIIKWCLYIFIFLMPLWFLPFTANILDFNKQILMIVVLTIALIAWLGNLLTQEKIKWHKGSIVLFFLTFVVICGLATIFSERAYDSLMGLDVHLSRALINVVYFFAFFLLVLNYLTEDRERRNAKILKFLTVFLVSSAIVGIIGLLQILGKFIFPWAFAETNSFNTIGTITSLGIFLAVVLPLTLSLLFSAKQQEERKKGKIAMLGLKIFLTVLVCLALITILLINNRTVWIITAIGMLIVAGFWLAKRHTFQSQNLGWLAIPVVILALCSIFLLFKPNLYDLNLPLELGLTQEGGVSIIKEVIQRNPVLGTGPETFIYNYSLYKPESINQTIFWNLRFSNAPSEILSLLSEVGILGVLAFLALIMVFLVKVVKGILVDKTTSNDGLSGIKMGLFAGWLGLMISWFIYPQNMTLMFTFWLFLVFLVVMNSKEKDIKIVNLKSLGKIALLSGFGFIVLMIVIVGLLYLGGSRFMAEVKYKTGFDLVNKGELNSGINKIIRATVINPYEDKFYKDLAQLFIAQVNQDLNNQDLDQQTRANRVQTGISNATNSAVRATTLNPKDVANWIIQGSTYRSLMQLVDGAGAWAVKSYEQALTLEPTNPFIYTEIARTYVAEVNLLIPQAQDEAIRSRIIGHLNEAEKVYKDAIKIKPNYSVAHFEIALVYDQQGRMEEAITRMENSKALSPRDVGVAFQLAVLYYKNSQFDKAAAEFTRTITLNENHSNARYFLGLLFDREGNKAAAIEQFEKIAELNPENEHIKQILANLRAGEPALGSPELGPPEQPEEVPIE